MQKIIIGLSIVGVLLMTLLIKTNFVTPSFLNINDKNEIVSTEYEKCDLSGAFELGNETGQCSAGYVCYQKGYSSGGIPAADGSASDLTEIGDNTCRKACESNNDCDNGTSCELVKVYAGDVTITKDYMCL